MTDRSPPTDDDLVLAALAGEVDEASLSPALRAEVAGLKAMRSLLDDDAAWGQQTGADVPPPHLLDAIVRAEVLARPDVIRNAVAASSSSSPSTSTSTSSGPKAWWQKLSSWAVGGGVVVSAAAALLITVERAPEVSQAAMKADVAAAPSAAEPMAPPPTTTPTAATPAPVTPPADALAFGSAESGAEGGENKASDRNEFADDVADNKPAELAKQAPEARKAEAPARDEAKGGAPKDSYAYDDAVGSRGDVDGVGGLGLASRSQGAGGGGSASGGPGAMQESASKNSVAPPPPPAPPASPASSAAPAPVVAAEPAPMVTPAAEARRVFRERLAEKADKAARAKEEASAPAKAKAKKSSASLDEEREAAPRPDFETAQRQRQVQQANDSLLTAENELAHGRFAVALDLAQRAEALAGGALGLAPASTSSRAYFGLKRYADAARVGSRLLQGDVRDTQVVDGLLAGAKGALQVGDHVLARRLLEHALKPANVDVARRAEAQRLLKSARAVPAEADAATSDQR